MICVVKVIIFFMFFKLVLENLENCFMGLRFVVVSRFCCVVFWLVKRKFVIVVMYKEKILNFIFNVKKECI